MKVIAPASLVLMAGLHGGSPEVCPGLFCFDRNGVPKPFEVLSGSLWHLMTRDDAFCCASHWGVLLGVLALRWNLCYAWNTPLRCNMRDVCMSLFPEAMDATEFGHIQGAWVLAEERELAWGVWHVWVHLYDRLVTACSSVGALILGTGALSGIETL